MQDPIIENAKIFLFFVAMRLIKNGSFTMLFGKNSHTPLEVIITSHLILLIVTMEQNSIMTFNCQ